ncbi:dhx29, partial [Symbiodinium sp. CCMP2456]
KETWCPVVRSVGFCAFFRGPCTYSCTDCIRFDDGGVEEVVINVEDVPSKLEYAGTGSSVPKSLQGIWWLDQDGYGAEKGLAGEDYPYDFNPVGEYAIGFGDKAVWQPHTLCLTPIYFWGGTRGHWAGANFGNGTTCCGSNVATRLTLSLCAVDDTLQEFDIWSRLVIPSVLAPVASSLGFEYAGSDYWWIPKGLIHLRMVKKPWGWDRVNNAAADWTRTKREELDSLLRFMPSQLTSLLNTANRTLHYPMFQLVDGDGNRTENWDHFVDFTQIKSKQNAVPGTLVVRQRTAPPEGFTKFR